MANYRAIAPRQPTSMPVNLPKKIPEKVSVQSGEISGSVTLKCRHCGQSPADLNISKERVSKGDFKPHEYLCLGTDIHGRPAGIPPNCLYTGCQAKEKTTATAWQNHYRKEHDIVLSEKFDLHYLRETYQPWLFPDFEMNGYWGTHVTKRNPFTEVREVNEYVNQALHNFYKFETESKVTLVNKYRETFERVFNVTPFSFHEHASDATTAVVSIITALEEFAPASVKLSVLTKKQRELGRVALLEGSFGAYHGPLANGGTSVIRNHPNTAVGRTERIHINEMRSRNSFVKKLKSLVQEGYIALVVEMVRQRDGRVLKQLEWETICKSCDEVGIYLIVDECLTAFRCGAFFAHQLPQYSGHRPSFVVFGKALAASGIAICWDGAHISRLGYSGDMESIEDIIKGWDLKTSRVQQPFTLLQSLGAILMADRDNWPERAVRIGNNLRSLLKELQPDMPVLGLGALIYLPTVKAKTLDVTGAAAGKSYRWLPYIDEGMDDISQIYQLFGEHGRSIRERLSDRVANFSTLFCIICGEQILSGIELCNVCHGSICEECMNGKDAERHLQGKCLSPEGKRKHSQ